MKVQNQHSETPETPNCIKPVLSDSAFFSDVFLLDCIEGMKQYSDNYFDLAIVDPPYGINATNMQMGTHKTRTKDGYAGISTATKIKGRLNSGSGKLKNRMLNKSVIDWDNEKPTKEYFNELFRFIIHLVKNCLKKVKQMEFL